MHRNDVNNNINESLIKKKSTTSYLAVLPIIFLYFTVIFGCSPLIQQIHIDQVCIDYESNDCTSVEVSQGAASLNLAASCVINIPAILMSGFYGAFADKYGRKAAMFCPMLGLTIWTSIYFYVDTYNTSYYRYFILLANFLMGLSGNFIAFIMASLCYTSDSTQSAPHTRKIAYSITEATIFAPQIFGPVATGLYASSYGFQIPILISAILCVISIFYLSFLPESLHLDAECRKFPLKFDPLKTFKNILYLFNHKCDNGKSPLPYVGSAFLLFFSSAMGGVSIRIIYFKHEFDWNPGEIGVYAGLEGVMIVFSMLLAPLFIKSIMGKFLKVITFIQVGYFFR
jgi:MFS family permease